jgi:hypothetical protein
MFSDQSCNSVAPWQDNGMARVIVQLLYKPQKPISRLGYSSPKASRWALRITSTSIYRVLSFSVRLCPLWCMLKNVLLTLVRTRNNHNQLESVSDPVFIRFTLAWNPWHRLSVWCCLVWFPMGFAGGYLSSFSAIGHCVASWNLGSCITAYSGVAATKIS